MRVQTAARPSLYGVEAFAVVQCRCESQGVDVVVEKMVPRRCAFEAERKQAWRRRVVCSGRWSNTAWEQNAARLPPCASRAAFSSFRTTQTSPKRSPPMSAAVKAAIAARRKALAEQQKQQQSTGDASPAASPLASRTTSPEPHAAASAALPELGELALAQATLPALLNKAAATGRANLAARHPALTQLPPQLWDLLAADPPAWRSGSTRPWFERPELSVLNVSNNEIRQCSERIDEFAALARLDVSVQRVDQRGQRKRGEATGPRREETLHALRAAYVGVV